MKNKELILSLVVFLLAFSPVSYNEIEVKKYHQEKRSILLGCTININTASLYEIEELPKIGSVKARKIIQGRPFHSTKDILRVKGIGIKTYRIIVPYIRIKDEPCDTTF